MTSELKLSIGIASLYVAIDEQDINKFNDAVNILKEAHDEVNIEYYENMFRILHTYITKKFDSDAIYDDIINTINLTILHDGAIIEQDLKNAIFCYVISNHNRHLNSADKYSIIDSKLKNTNNAILKTKMLEMMLNAAIDTTNTSLIKDTLEMIQQYMMG